MRIRLIAPFDPDDHGRSSGETFKIRRRNLPLLAGLTPPGHDVEIVDESFAPSSHEAGPDLVGITVMTELARRAYHLGDHYSALGAKVVMGGVHATVLPGEALVHADAVVRGEAESVWAGLVADAAAGTLQQVYEDRGRLPLAGVPRPRWDLYPSPARRGYTPVGTGIETSRGCPYDCEFCSIGSVFGAGQRLRPASEVIAEIESLQTSHLFLVDDSLGLDRRASRELFTAMAPLGKSWVGQGTIALAEDPALLRLMRRSGCRGLLVGFETLHPGTRRGFRKLDKRIDPGEALRRFHGAGLAILGAFVFGFDNEDPGVFDRMLEFARGIRLDAAQVRVLVPFPGTALYARLLREGRLLAPKWWLDGYSTDTLLYRPIGMSPEDLVTGIERVIREFYSGGSVFRRYFGIPPWRRGLFGSAVFAGLNLGMRTRYLECLRVPQPFLHAPETLAVVDEEEGSPVGS
jgi:radical SAM superfamily enzyme YgiQ (UPF0313 family)